jgi:apolipoprotein N-acyltransferase
VVESSQSKRLPIGYLVGGTVGLIAYLIFFIWVCYSVYMDKGIVLSVLVALSIAIPFKMFAAPRIMAFLKSKKL